MDISTRGFAAALHAGGPDPEHAKALQLYGRFVGSWDSEIVVHAPDGATHQATGEIHFGWILRGRAVQDVWIIHPRAGLPPLPIAGHWYGTTLRVYDPTIDAWRINWSDPARSLFRQQIGRADGSDIVQEGTTESGELTRWSFREITPASFRWLGESKPAGAQDWRLVLEVIARRRQ